MSNHWVVNSDKAKQLIEKGTTILDVRNQFAWLKGHIPGAIRISWQQFSQKQVPHKGKLIEDTKILEEKLRQVGIFNDKPVVVVGGNPADGFGEEGRIVWMLRSLGHSQAFFVDGGYPALVQAGVPTVWQLTQVKEKGDFIVKRTAFWEIQADELRTSLSKLPTEEASSKIAIIDTRELREYEGATPYGEKRRGHIPGAIHFYFKDLLDKKGNLLPHEQIIAKLEKLGIQQDTPIFAYCTGGIRSAFFVAVLTDLGFTHVKNYAGSMWEWSAGNSSTYILEK